MQTVLISVGIEVFKDSLAVYSERLTTDRSIEKIGLRNFHNTGDGIKKLVKWIITKASR